jgi:hypothetical protein
MIIKPLDIEWSSEVSVIIHEGKSAGVRDEQGMHTGLREILWSWGNECRAMGNFTELWTLVQG